MKGHIAFCPHFHQPHFQLYRTREEAYKNSYQPWLQLLSQAINLDSFFINLHFSGPFLYWLRDMKVDYLEQFRTLLGSGKIGLLGGLADEPFIQLSSRNDDVLYQLQQYDQLLFNVTGISAKDWQGIHLVERECGEMLLHQVSQAARSMQAAPIVYLDAETFYTSHFSYPGSEADYCLKHFGFKDPFSKTTISHLPQSLLFFALRDEINGEEFFSFPVHSQFRYQLLKRNSFTGEDRVRIKPKHYYFYIKDALEKAYHGVRELGRPLEPLLLIFEDAEKFGQWSKDPYGDLEWLMEFFSYIDKDPDLSFTGLKDYLNRYGYLDTYPASSSHSYPEWENWTARRGIRGVTFGDERLRRVICRLRDAERLQDRFETLVLNKAGLAASPPELADLVQRSLLSSPERFVLVEKVLEYYFPQWSELYSLINRVRHLVYQEDPKWASRHPSYGSSPFYDMHGLAYLEIALRLLGHLLHELEEPIDTGMVVTDWDMDGEPEVLVQGGRHFLVADPAGGCISYQHVLAPQADASLEYLYQLLKEDFRKIRSYNHIHQSSYSLVMTESDSDLCQYFYPEGGRREVSRNSMRCAIRVRMNDQEVAVGDFDTRGYMVETSQNSSGQTIIHMKTESALELVGRDPITIFLSKEFLVDQDSLQVTFKAKMDRIIDNLQFFLVPELVTSAAPSDEVHFKPCAWLGITPAQTGSKIKVLLNDLVTINETGTKLTCLEKEIPAIDRLDYLYRLDSADGSSYFNQISYQIAETNPVDCLEVKPAVSNYYRNYVFEDQSRLSYHTSGIMICPLVAFEKGQALFSTRVTWQLDAQGDPGSYAEVLPLIEGCIG